MNLNYEKVFFSIGEVAQLLGVKTSVLRYWESEFNQIRPQKNNAGVRRYQKSDIELINRIKTLLYEEKFTIEGARQYLNQQQHMPQIVQAAVSDDTIQRLVATRDRLQRLLRSLEEQVSEENRGEDAGEVRQ